ncbi:MAG: ABC transporter permease, partial [Gemmatimonadaceae bacterium]
RYGVRGLKRNPFFAAAAVLTLALGIGANTAIFSLTNALVLRSLPVQHPEQLLDVYMKFPGDISPLGNNNFTNPLWEQIRGDSSVFESSFAYGDATFNLAPTGEVRNVNGAWVSGDFFRSLGVRAEAGRLLRQSDDVRGCPAVAAVSDGFAQREFGGARNAVGKAVSLSGNPFTIAGVVDQGFSGIEVGRNPEVYAPLCTEPLFYGPKVLDARSRWYLLVIGRPKPRLTAGQINAGLATAAPAMFRSTQPSGWGASDVDNYLKTSLGAAPSPSGISEVRNKYQAALYFLLAAVFVVLLIACANIANLLLARGVARQREIAIRMAIGAGRRRVVRQLFTESLVIALLGATAGMVFAQWAARLLVRFISVRQEGVSLDLAADGRVLGFTIGVAVATALLFGLLPAWRATRVDPQTAMKAGGRGVVAGDTRYRGGRALVVGQVALSLSLVSVAALLMASFRKLVTQDPGFDSHGVLVATMDFSRLAKLDPQSTAWSAKARQTAYAVVQRQMVDNLRSAPGVKGAAAVFITAASGIGWNELLSIPGYTPPAPGKKGVGMSYFNQVSDGYFELMHTSVITGRGFTDADGAGGPLVAVINEAAAHQFFGSANPVGRTYSTIEGDSVSPPVRIIGEVATQKYASMSEKPRPTIYLPVGQGDGAGPEISYVIRGNGTPASLIPAVKTAAARLSPSISLEFTTLDEQISRSVARPRLLAVLSGFFGALALLLAVIGLYGTISYTVTRRRNEIGIRMALGAAGGRVLGMIVGEAGRLVAIGLAAGVLLSLATTRFVSSFLFDVTPTDPTLLLLSALVLGAVAMGAALLPAWRASGVDPMDALREE